eukprot:scaffold93319_cov63-Phaeocystis_antarctica.AAC.7
MPSPTRVASAPRGVRLLCPLPPPRRVRRRPLPTLVAPLPLRQQVLRRAVEQVLRRGVEAAERALAHLHGTNRRRIIEPQPQPQPQPAEERRSAFAGRLVFSSVVFRAPVRQGDRG